MVQDGLAGQPGRGGGRSRLRFRFRSGGVREQGVVPLPVPAAVVLGSVSQLSFDPGVADRHPGGVEVLVEDRAGGQPGSGGDGADGVDDDVVAGQGAGTPGEADLAEQPVMLMARIQTGNSSSAHGVMPMPTSSTSAVASPAAVTQRDTILVRRAMVTVVSVNTAAIRAE